MPEVKPPVSEDKPDTARKPWQVEGEELLPDAVQLEIDTLMRDYGEMSDRSSPEDFPDGYVLTRTEIVLGIMRVLAVAKTVPELQPIPDGLSDDKLRKVWKAMGGHFFGPNVEHGAMPEDRLLPYLRGLYVQARTVRSASGKLTYDKATRSIPDRRSQNERRKNPPVAVSTKQPSDELIRLAVLALREAEAILGGEYGDQYGVLAETMAKLDAALSAIGTRP